MYNLFEYNETEKAYKWFDKARSKFNAESKAFFRVKNGKTEKVLIEWNNKKVCEYFWLKEYKTDRKIQIINICWGNYHSCFEVE